MQTLGYVFKDDALLVTALTHRSVRGANNERLEFLGDAVVNFLIAETLYALFPKAREGRLSRLRSMLVNGDSLAELAQSQFKLSHYIRMGNGEIKAGGHFRHSVLADCFEAIIASIYLDGGLEACRACVGRWFAQSIDKAQHAPNQKDPKTRLQEWSQAQHYSLPDYTIDKIEGESHAQLFYVSCRVQPLPHRTEGIGKSRRRAEQDAAKHYLTLLEQSP